MQPIIEEIKDKRIAIMGFGREGKSTYQYIRRYLPEKLITIADMHPIDDAQLHHVNIQCGSNYQDLAAYDIIFKSPGIVLEKEEHMDAMDSQTNMFLKYYGKQTIGITGTKGKSTTSSLLYHLLKENKKDVLFLGNIGKPAFDYIEEIKEDTLIVFELSCHQLEYTKHDPHIGVLLNIFEEHLDHYGTYEKYVHAKENVWRLQKEEDLLICEKTLCHPDMKAHVISASMDDVYADIYADVHAITMGRQHIQMDPMDTPLLGHHNLYDVAIDLYIVQQLGISLEDALAALKTFTPLPHRLQYVGEYEGIHWYDDSISTICETTIQALVSLPQCETLLLGGMDRGIDYTPLADYLNTHPVKNIILMPDSGEVLARLLTIPNVYHVKDLQEAVQLAKKITTPGTIALLSPAAASYGFFKNFEERGDQFQAYVKAQI